MYEQKVNSHGNKCCLAIHTRQRWNKITGIGSRQISNKHYLLNLVSTIDSGLRACVHVCVWAGCEEHKPVRDKALHDYLPYPPKSACLQLL